ncbi:MAG TPA: phosphatidate cytidylyltransferase [Pirellulaceae bacterium]|nr:phosphatidate cytidylyltransferase [Pirellulaceae bacterium]HMO92667.1 phosphatidate cytidylyltransferase [Pirellulaceae bacterium]HMP70585.1 phosphatidate cytidylyltransferase [Pirellulaceae bacterium]
MLIYRILSALVIVTGLTLLVWLDIWLGNTVGINGLVALPITAIIAMMATAEVLWLQEDFQAKPNSLLVYASTLTVIVSAFLPMLWMEAPAGQGIERLHWLLYGMVISIGMILFVEMSNYRKPGSNVIRIALALMVVCYIGLLLSFLGPLRLYHNNHWGIVAVLSMIVPVKASDTAAYTIGKIFGKHKFTPVLSPGKTYEGVVGGFLGGFAGTLIVFKFLLPLITGATSEVSLGVLLAFSAMVTSLGIAGDLIASVLKRDGGRKNSSRWLPGLGGVLDIIDSPLAVTPAVYMFWASGLLGPARSI